MAKRNEKMVRANRDEVPIYVLYEGKTLQDHTPFHITYGICNLTPWAFIISGDGDLFYTLEAALAYARGCGYLSLDDFSSIYRTIVNNFREAYGFHYAGY